MTDTWISEHWGPFKTDRFQWEAWIASPFKQFCYDSGFGKGAKDQFKLAFQPADPTNKPSPAAIALAVQLLADPDALADLITQSLFDDFHGDGPGSGYWWDGDVDAVEEIIGVELPDDHQAVASLLRLSCILIREEHRLHIDGPIAVVSFGALFEEEHGVEFLTDGHEIYGIGYAASVEPFS